METNKKTDNWNAQHYKKHSQCQFERGVSTIRGIDFRGNEQILDVGCGDGRTTAEFAKKVPNGKVFGIDVSQNMITEAQKSFGNITNLEFQCIDAADFAQELKYDLAVSFSAFHWIAQQMLVLKNICTALKSGGHLIIKMGGLHKSPVSDIRQSAKWAPFLSKKEQTYFPQTVQSLSNMLEEAGFKNINVTLDIVARTFRDKDELFNWAFAWVPNSTGLPEDKAREFSQDMVDAVCATRNDGQIILESAFLDATATKP